MANSLDIDRFRKEISGKDLDQIGDFQLVQEEILKSSNCFWRPIDFPNLSPDRVQKAMAKMVAEGEIIRIIRGLYWRGEKDERDEVIRPKVLDSVKAVLEIEGGIGYSSFTATKKLGFEAEKSDADRDIAIAVPCRGPRSTPGAVIVSRSGSQGRIYADLNWLEVSLLEVLIDWGEVTKDSPKNKDRLKELVNGFKGNEVDFDNLEIDPEKLVLASKTEKAKVRDSLINVFEENGQEDLSRSIIPVRKRNYHPGVSFD